VFSHDIVACDVTNSRYDKVPIERERERVRDLSIEK